MTLLDDKRFDQFVAELAELSAKHGIAIEGGVSFIMEGDDFLFGYGIDEDGRLVRQ